MLNSIGFLIFGWMFLYAVFFYKRQNEIDKKTGKPKQVGGDISPPKSLWLAYTLGAWFLFSIPSTVYLYLEASPWFLCFLVISLSWWIRGILELFMIYRWLNWSPKYGISHDLGHIFVISFILIQQIQSNPETLSSLSWPLVYVCGHILTVGFETLFAALFFKTRGENADLIYFASNDPRYRLINRLTWVGVVFSYSHFLISILLI